MYRISLHLGAHKTATSHFRALLEGNQALLDKHDVAAPKAIVIRREITSHLSRLGPNTALPESPADILSRLSAGHRNLYMLDENILGTPVALLGRGRMYPQAAPRLDRALRFLEGVDIQILLSIRNPVTFVRASYLETVRNNGFLSFAEYRKKTPLTALRWLPLIEDLHKAAPDVPIHVWCYEDYAKLTPRLVALALNARGVSAAEITPLTEITRPSLSARALAALQKSGVRKTDPRGSYKIKRIMETYPKSAEFPPPEVWSAAEKDTITQGYHRDIKDIMAMDEIVFLGV